MHRFLPMKVTGISILIAVIGIMSGCTGSLSMQQKRDATYLMGVSDTHMKTWLLQETYDPYNGGVLIETEPDRPRYFMVFQDGGFLQYDAGMYNAGTWLLDQERERMALLYKTQHNRPVPQDRVDSTYRYQVLLHTADSLIIGIQGRHGIYEKRYQTAPPDFPPLPNNE